MTYHSIRDRLLLSVGSTVITGLLLTAASQTQASAERINDSNFSTSSNASNVSSYSSSLHFWEALDLKSRNAWTELRKQLAWQHMPLSADAQARVNEWIERYQNSPENIVAIARRAAPWLAWINQKVAERGLPGEIALLPFVESSFDPTAKSHRGAAGLWQFMPGTGDALGLVRNRHYDGRLDVVASTQAALDYIEMQADQWYDGDLVRSLAAYNAGAGTVNRAVRNAESQGKQGKYWDLQLPGETMDYVPKLLAINAIIANPEAYNIDLPEIDSKPAFAMVTLDQSLSLEDISMRSGIGANTLAELNPGLLNGSLNPGYSRTLLVPHDTHPQVMAQLTQPDTVNSNAMLASNSNAAPLTHRVERGDNLSNIAQRYNLSLRDIMRWNAIDRPEALQPGQLLTLSSS
ncbi:transglycosylase SLT domain-containing protein [Vreelandella aquamarina]